jgi:hypothetical protein
MGTQYTPAFTATTLHALAALADQGHDPEALVLGACAFSRCLPMVAHYDGELRTHCQVLDTHDTALAPFAALAWVEGYKVARNDRAARLAVAPC